MPTEDQMQKVAKKLCQGQLTLQDLKVDRKFIRDMKDAGYRILSHLNGKGKTVYYIQAAVQNPWCFIGPKTKNPQKVSWVEMSDVHAGSNQFDEAGLRQVLKQAQDEGIEDIHLSGDVCDGYKVYPGHMTNLRYWKAQDQADQIAAVLLAFAFRYYAIKGNHDYSFERYGSPNPVALIEQHFKAENRPFTYLNGYAGDLIIAGVVKRMVHLFGGRTYAKSYPGQTYIRNLFDSHGENVYINGKKYRLRFLQCGHYHTDISYEAGGMFVTHPGNYQFPNDYTVRQGLVGYQGSRFTRATIEDGHVVEYQSRFIRPKRKND